MDVSIYEILAGVVTIISAIIGYVKHVSLKKRLEQELKIKTLEVQKEIDKYDQNLDSLINDVRILRRGKANS